MQNTTPTNPDGQPRYDDRATEIIKRHIENDQELLDIVRSIVHHAYEDASHEIHEWAANPDKYPGALTTPRLDAGDAIRELFDERNPLYEDGGVYLTLLDLALDRCDWYAIVDHQRRVMDENRAADLARAAERAAIEDAVWSPIWRALNFL